MAQKKVLLVMPGYMAAKIIGGTGRSLLNLLATFDRDRYAVDLAILGSGALFIDLLPADVRRVAFSPLVTAAINLVYRSRIAEIAGKLLGRYAETVRWRILKPWLGRENAAYDVAIGYATEYICQAYMLDSVEAKKKISIIHIDFAREAHNGQLIRAYDEIFARVDAVSAVSETAQASFAKLFPRSAGKVATVKNIVSAAAITRLAGEAITPLAGGGQTGIVTVAGFGSEKGPDLALAALKLLIADGYAVKWYFIGDGETRADCERYAAAEGLGGHAIFLGTRDNPYPYVRAADIYVQPSRSESYCLAVDEALILRKPVVVTDIPAFRARLTAGENALFATPSAEGIAAAVKRLIDSPGLRETLAAGAARLDLDTKGEIGKLYSLFG